MKLEYNKGILFVRLKGHISHSVSHNINMYLVPKILEQKIKYLVFNMYDVSDIDSFGIDALLNTKCAIKTNKGKICLCELSDNLKKKINTLKLKKVNNEISAINEIGV